MNKARKEKLSHGGGILNDIKDLGMNLYLSITLTKSLSPCYDYMPSIYKYDTTNNPCYYFVDSDYSISQNVTDDDQCAHTCIQQPFNIFYFDQEYTSQTILWISIAVNSLMKLIKYIMYRRNSITRTSAIFTDLLISLTQAMISILCFSMAQVKCTGICVQQALPDVYTASMVCWFVGLLSLNIWFAYYLFKTMFCCMCFSSSENNSGCYCNKCDVCLLFLFSIISLLCMSVANSLLLFQSIPVLNIQIALKIVFVFSILYSLYTLYDLYSMKKNQKKGTVYYDYHQLDS